MLSTLESAASRGRSAATSAMAPVAGMSGPRARVARPSTPLHHVCLLLKLHRKTAPCGINNHVGRRTCLAHIALIAPHLSCRCKYTAPCYDVTPPDVASCDQLHAAGRCSDPFTAKAGWCRRTCGACEPPPPLVLAAAPVPAAATAVASSSTGTGGGGQPSPSAADFSAPEVAGTSPVAAAPNGGVSSSDSGGGSSSQKATGTAVRPPSSGTCSINGCIDMQPPGSLPCSSAVVQAQCAREWFVAAGYCARTCGRC